MIFEIQKFFRAHMLYFYLQSCNQLFLFRALFILPTSQLQLANLFVG